MSRYTMKVFFEIEAEDKRMAEDVIRYSTITDIADNQRIKDIWIAQVQEKPPTASGRLAPTCGPRSLYMTEEEIRNED